MGVLADMLISIDPNKYQDYMVMEKGKKVLFLTNNSTKTPQEYADKLRRMGLYQTKVNAAIWMKRFKHFYEYQSVWIDDFNICSKDPMKYVEQLEKNFVLNRVEKPEYYLKADMANI